MHPHIDPSTGEVQAEVPLGGPADVAAAVAAARKAAPGWRDTPPEPGGAR
jgi:acyl-CoA reductase-like NAD-dependent aldehyde dehydrogenase